VNRQLTPHSPTVSGRLMKWYSIDDLFSGRASRGIVGEITKRARAAANQSTAGGVRVTRRVV